MMSQLSAKKYKIFEKNFLSLIFALKNAQKQPS